MKKYLLTYNKFSDNIVVADIVETNNIYEYIGRVTTKTLERTSNFRYTEIKSNEDIESVLSVLRERGYTEITPNRLFTKTFKGV